MEELDPWEGLSMELHMNRMCKRKGTYHGASSQCNARGHGRWSVVYEKNKHSPPYFVNIIHSIPNVRMF